MLGIHLLISITDGSILGRLNGLLRHLGKSIHIHCMPAFFEDLIRSVLQVLLIHGDISLPAVSAFSGIKI